MDSCSQTAGHLLLLTWEPSQYCIAALHEYVSYCSGPFSAAGTAIETNINGRFKFTVHKNGTLPPKLQDLNFPLLENANEYVVHGYTVSVSLFPCHDLLHTSLHTVAQCLLKLSLAAV